MVSPCGRPEELLELREELEALVEPFCAELLAAAEAEPDAPPEDTFVLVLDEALLRDDETLDETLDAARLSDVRLALALAAEAPRPDLASQLASARELPVSSRRSSTAASRASRPQRTSAWVWVVGSAGRGTSTAAGGSIDRRPMPPAAGASGMGEEDPESVVDTTVARSGSCTATPTTPPRAKRNDAAPASRNRTLVRRVAIALPRSGLGTACLPAWTVTRQRWEQETCSQR